MRHLSFLFALFALQSLHAQTPGQNLSVPLTATVTTDPPAISLHWKRNPAGTGYKIFRKSKTAATFPAQMVSLPAGDSTWTDLDVDVNMPYEYKVQETTTSGQGYVLSSIALAPEHARGRVILVVDSTFSNTLAAEITRLTDDLEGDGWEVERIDVARTNSVSTVKALITNAYDESPETTKYLFLLGHVPVPYSGQTGPDGHSDHVGAWSCDGYYGDFNTGWTDQFVTAINSSNPRNHNMLGDGKFDQNNFPSDLELGVGRVDLSDLSAFSLSETELMRRYLDKDHAWRHKLFTVPDRGCVEDNFTDFGEGFSQNGWRNFPPLVGADSVEAINWNELKNKDYLWAYGCGGGWYQGASDIVTTGQYAQDSMRAVFTMTFGSYFGDWDNSNNLLRAALGSGTILSNAWAGRPHWAFHPMGLGETLGYCTRISMNNTGAYPTGYSARGVHMALLGDPTLRQQIVAPPQNPTSLEMNSHVQLQWTPPNDAWDGFFVYRRTVGTKELTLLNQAPITETFIWDSCRTTGATYEYRIRTARLETTPSGTFWNLSQAVRHEVTVTTTLPQVSAAFSWSILLNEPLTVSFEGDTSNASSLIWNFGDGTSDTAAFVQHTFPDPATYHVTLTAYGPCDQKVSYDEMISLNGVAVQPEPTAGAWRVFPNPARGVVRLENSASVPGSVDLRVLSTGGVEIFADKITQFTNRTIPLENVPAGLYLLEIRTETGVFTRKIQVN